MTVRETVEIIRESALWDTLTIKEKTEALAYAMESTRCRMAGEDSGQDVSDLIGEIFAS